MRTRFCIENGKTFTLYHANTIKAIKFHDVMFSAIKLCVREFYKMKEKRSNNKLSKKKREHVRPCKAITIHLITMLLNVL